MTLSMRKKTTVSFEVFLDPVLSPEISGDLTENEAVAFLVKSLLSSMDKETRLSVFRACIDEDATRFAGDADKKMSEILALLKEMG